MGNSFVIKGNICQTKTMEELDLYENSYVVCIDGISQGIFEELPEEYKSLQLIDCTDKLISLVLPSEYQGSKASPS